MVKRLAEFRKSEWFSLFLFSFLVSGILFVSYGYIDLKSLTAWTLNLWDCLADGNLYGYYEYCARNIYHLDSAYMGSNYLALIPWAVWNLPIWVLQRFFGVIAVGHAWTLLYSKIFVVLVYFITVSFTYRILTVMKIETEGRTEAVYLAFSFPFAMTAVYFAGQTDIISICLFVIAVYQLIQGKRNRFLLFAALSMGAKPYILIAYVAVLLLTEKNIWKILRDAIIGMSPMLLFHLIYRNAPMYQESMSMGPGAGQLEATRGMTVSSPSGISISLFLVSLIVFYFLIYIRPWGGQRAEELVYAVVVPFLLFFMFADYKHYRVIYLFPFLYILFAVKTDRLFYNLLAECVINMGIALKFYLTNGGFFSNWYVFDFVRKFIPDIKLGWLERIHGIKENVMEYGNPVYVIASSVVFAAFVLLLFINLSKFPQAAKWKEEESGISVKMLLWVRALLPLLLVLLSFYRN